MGEKTKTYLVDNNPVDVAEQDEQDFLKHNPTAVKAKTFLVGQDTVDVAQSDLADFQKHVPDAKPLLDCPCILNPPRERTNMR